MAVKLEIDSQRPIQHCGFIPHPNQQTFFFLLKLNHISKTSAEVNLGTIFNENCLTAQKIDTWNHGVCRRFSTQHLLPQRVAQL